MRGGKRSPAAPTFPRRNRARRLEPSKPGNGAIHGNEDARRRRRGVAVQYARAMVLPACAVDVDDDKLMHAKCLGADAAVNASEGDPAKAVHAATDGGVHGVPITAPSLGAFRQGMGMTRKRGTCTLVGLPPGELPAPLFDVVANCVAVRDSFVETRQDMAETLAFAAEGKVRADIELQPLSAINAVLDRLEHGGDVRPEWC